MQSASEDAKHVRLVISASGPERSNLISVVVATFRRLGITVLSRQTASAHGLSASLRVDGIRGGVRRRYSRFRAVLPLAEVSDERLGDTRVRSNGGRP